MENDFEFIDAEKAQCPLDVLCDVLDVSCAGFHAWKKRPPSARKKRDDELAEQVVEIHAKSSKRYGSPRVHKALKKRGERVSRKRVMRLMREKGLRGKRRRRFRVTTNSNHAHPIASNVLALPITRLMGPEVGKFTSLMGPRNFQGHGATRGVA